MGKGRREDGGAAAVMAAAAASAGKSQSPSAAVAAVSSVAAARRARLDAQRLADTPPGQVGLPPRRLRAAPHQGAFLTPTASAAKPPAVDSDSSVDDGDGSRHRSGLDRHSGHQAGVATTSSARNPRRRPPPPGDPGDHQPTQPTAARQSSNVGQAASSHHSHSHTHSHTHDNRHRAGDRSAQSVQDAKKEWYYWQERLSALDEARALVVRQQRHLEQQLAGHWQPPRSARAKPPQRSDAPAAASVGSRSPRARARNKGRPNGGGLRRVGSRAGSIVSVASSVVSMSASVRSAMRRTGAAVDDDDEWLAHRDGDSNPSTGVHSGFLAPEDMTLVAPHRPMVF